MDALFASGLIADLVIAVLAAEAAAALWLRGWPGAQPVLRALLPGVLLALALRAALTDAHWGWVALWLTAALPAHLLDLRARLR